METVRSTLKVTLIFVWNSNDLFHMGTSSIVFIFKSGAAVSTGSCVNMFAAFISKELLAA